MTAGSTSLLAWGQFITGVAIVVALLFDQEKLNSTGQAFAAYKPWVFPLFCAMGLILIGGFELVTKTHVNPAKYDKPNVYSYRAGVGTFAIMLIFAASFEILGFVVSSFIAMTLLSVFAGARNWFQIFIFASLLPTLLYVLMVYIMGVSLPAGLDL